MKSHISLNHIAALGAGLYIGYKEGKGMDVSPELEYIAKYGPTTLAAALTSPMIYFIKKLMQYSNKKLYEGAVEGTINIKKGLYGKDAILKDFPKDKRKELTDFILETYKQKEKKIEETKYLKPTVINTSYAMLETLVGYGAGKLISQII
ncbi:hypothetical protein ACFLTH_13930 [Bacteroidota bacterium]